MERSNPSLPKPSLLLDTDVIVNWLAQEQESVTGIPLWQAPLEIIKWINQGYFRGFVSLISILEIRFLLRRKRQFSEGRIKRVIEKLQATLELVLLGDIELLRADRLQSEYPMDPFDSILLATAFSLEPVTLISRDSAFRKIAGKWLEVALPEEFLQKNNPSSSPHR